MSLCAKIKTDRRNMERLQKQSCEHVKEMAIERQLMTDILWNDIIALHRKLLNQLF